LAQVLSKHHDDTAILDRFSFVRESRGQRQLTASESVLPNLLQLCLRRDSILVLDGIDECTESETFVSSLLNIWRASFPRILLLSRVNVAGLKRSVPEKNQMRISKDMVFDDIKSFSHCNLQRLFEEAILPESAQGEKDTMVEHLVHGANGMFLWARLMINFLRSPAMLPQQRLDIIAQIGVPEGLEKMYERIILFIKKCGNYAETLAAKVLTQLLYATAPISSRHIRQALIADGFLAPGLGSGSIKEFEDSVVMACAGLVEHLTLSQCPPFLRGQSSLQVIHLSVNEILIEHHSRPAVLLVTPTPKLIPDPAIASLVIANCCLRQLLFHVPSQPLAGRFDRRISAQELYDNFCFADYSAVFWLDHVQKFIHITRNHLAYRNWSPCFLDSLSSFASSLSIFLEHPRTLSVWLEAFYTTDYYKIDPTAWRHPANHTLQGLADWARYACQKDSRIPIHAHLIDNVQGFSAEILNVANTWNHRLREAPNIIWDEMTGFVPGCRFFLSPGSTKVYYQQPVAPSHLPTSERRAALVSKLSGSGSIKGVLSIWPNPYVFVIRCHGRTNCV
jgi:hypothetical protein